MNRLRKLLVVLAGVCLLAISSPVVSPDAEAVSCQWAFRYHGSFDYQWNGQALKISYAGYGDTPCKAQAAPEVTYPPGINAGPWKNGWHPVTGYANYSVSYTSPTYWINHAANYQVI